MPYGNPPERIGHFDGWEVKKIADYSTQKLQKDKFRKLQGGMEGGSGGRHQGRRFHSPQHLSASQDFPARTLLSELLYLHFELDSSPELLHSCDLWRRIWKLYARITDHCGGCAAADMDGLPGLFR